MSEVRLGINIDHVATLRQARMESYPSLVRAAEEVMEAGAEQITIHLREDRRHIQDYDLSAIKSVTDRHNRLLNLELGANQEIIDIAIELKPSWMCFVPEKREEMTTEGGLNMKDPEQFKRIKVACEQIRAKSPNSKISLFVESDKEILEKCIELKVDAVEIHTGDYARAFLAEEDLSEHLVSYKNSKELIESNNISYHAGHGLTDESVLPLVKEQLFSEYNIGHWVICESVYFGLKNTVERLNKIVKGL